MTKPDGFFELQTAKQLFEKLESDFERLKSAAPISREAQYAAFDFFVTAEHLPEWLAKGKGANLSTLRAYADHPLVSHIANGAKHFRVDPNRHNAVHSTQAHSGAFDFNAFDNGAFDVDRLIIEREAVLDIAARILEHWRALVR
ncbi:MAG: hypothetical protein ACREO5_07115 [Candidatus Binatia bacterium]